jgi:ParB family transcriptional regulator, chromosome partitioning protein
MITQKMSTEGVKEVSERTEGRRIEFLPVWQIQPPKYNPRKRMDPVRLEELTSSIRRHGVLQNLVVVPAGDQYELLAGARRHQALLAIRAEVDAYYDSGRGDDEQDVEMCRLQRMCNAVPCLIKEGADADEALEVQLVENLQREDLDPVAEAEGYRYLMEARGYTAQKLAERIGKTNQHVVQRLRVPLCPAFFLDAMREGRVSISHCELIGRIPAVEDREEAARRVLAPKYDTKPLTRDEAAEMIRREFVVGLQSCGFDPESTRLVPDAPACSVCEWRSGRSSKSPGREERAE